MKRRAFIKATAILSLAPSLLAIAPSAIAKWKKEAFEADTLEKAMTEVFGSTEAETSEKIKIKAPDLAENGAMVPVAVESKLEGTESISIFLPANPVALAASFHFGEGSETNIKTRLKMGKTTDVVAVVKAGDKLYSSKVEVKVTKGGCGG